MFANAIWDFYLSLLKELGSIELRVIYKHWAPDGAAAARTES